jgi:membrane protease YdiL (CAAX protease family)
VIHLLALLLLHPFLRAHSMGVRDAFGVCSPAWIRHCAVAALLTLPALAAAWLLHRGSGWLLDLLSIPHDAQEAVDAVRAAGRGWERFLLFAFAAGSAPVVEEILFRGILWPLARDHGWPRLGALAVSMAFALIHLNLAAFLPLCALGLFWIWLYERTGDLTSCMLSHGLFNGLNFVWILLLPAPPAP